MKYLAKQSEAFSFISFLNEARGFSKEVEEYSNLVKQEALSELTRYLNFKFKGDFTNYHKDILVKVTKNKISNNTLEIFPINSILLKFRISAVDSIDWPEYSAYYQQNYDKYEISKRSGKANIVIYCKLIIPRKGDNLDYSILEDYVTRILNHELLHAYQDYKNPNFLKDHRFAALFDLVKKDRVFSKSSATVELAKLLYATSDAEIWAISGEKENYSSLDELRQDSYYSLARTAIEFDPEEWAELITLELERFPNSTKIINSFGERFVELYKAAVPNEISSIDPKITRLEKQPLESFILSLSPKIKSQGEKLLRRLARKINN
jgi:hypothetical protein